MDVGVVSPGPTLDAVVDVCSGKDVVGGAGVVAVVVKSGLLLNRSLALYLEFEIPFLSDLN